MLAEVGRACLPLGARASEGPGNVPRFRAFLLLHTDAFPSGLKHSAQCSSSVASLHLSRNESAVPGTLSF